MLIPLFAILWFLFWLGILSKLFRCAKIWKFHPLKVRSCKMTRFEKFQKFESEIKEKYENFSRIDSEYVEVVREYLKMIEEVDEIREESLQIPRDSEEGRLFQRKLEDKRKLEAMKYHQEYVLYSKRMELYAEICRTDHSQFLRENLPALQAPVTVENRSNAAEIGGDDSSILSAATETEGTIESYHKMNEEFLEEQRKRIFNRFMLENSEFQPLVHSSPASKTIDDTEFSDFSEFTNTQDQEDPIAAYFEFEREVLFGESDRSDPTGKTQQPSDSDRSNTAGKFDEIIDVIKENGAEDSFTFNDLVSPSNAVEQVTPPKSTTRKSQLPQPTFKTSKRHPGGSPVSPRTPTAPNLSQFSPNRTQTTPERSPITPPQSRLRPPRSPWTPSPRTPTQTPKTSRAPIRRRKTPETTPNSSFKRKLRTPEETPTSSLHTPKRAPGHKISKLSCEFEQFSLILKSLNRFFPSLQAIIALQTIVLDASRHRKAQESRRWNLT